MFAQTLRATLAPVGLLVLAFFLQPLAAALPAQQQALAVYLPPALLMAAMAFSWLFHRSRVFFALAASAFAYAGLWSVSFNPLQHGFRGEVVQTAVALLLPLNVALFAFSKERGIVTRHGAARLLLVAAQVALVTWIASAGGDEVAKFLQHTGLPRHWWAGLDLHRYALMVCIAALLALLVRYAIHRSPLDMGLFGALTAILPVLIGAASHMATMVFFAAAALIMSVALMQDSYGMAYLDELTGLPGRRALRQNLLQLGSRYALAMVDVDHFKKFNDTYGHDVGDQVLRMVATKLGKVSGGGKAFRYGGEEFTVVFHGKRAADVMADLDTLRQSIEDAPFALRGKNRPRRAPKKRIRRDAVNSVRMTVSIGVADRDERRTLPDEVLKAADQALYRAKNDGRNRVCKATSARARRD